MCGKPIRNCDQKRNEFANVKAEEEIRNYMVEIVKYRQSILKEYSG